MLLRVARLAQTFQVIPVQSHVRIVDVLRREMDLVVNDLRRHGESLRETSLTQAAASAKVCPPRVDPRCRSVEPFCELFHGKKE